MTLVKAVTATNGAKGFDNDTPLIRLAEKFACDYDFCVRYISRHIEPVTKDHTINLTRTEVQEILDSGLALMLVQHVRKPHWKPYGHLGTTDGKNAVINANNLEHIPSKTTIWLDLEGVKQGTETNLITDYCNQWYKQVENGGYTPGIYIGYDSGLNSTELYEDLLFQHYWKSLSSGVPTPINRGYQMIQSRGGNEHHISIDKDSIKRDNGKLHTQLPIWAIKGTNTSSPTT